MEQENRPLNGSWWALAFRGDVFLRALKTGLLVGTILVLINHGDALLAGNLDRGRLLRMGLTFMVPYLVSTSSSVGALRSREGGRHRG